MNICTNTHNSSVSLASGDQSKIRAMFVGRGSTAMQQREDHTFLAKFPAQTGWFFLPWSVCAIAQVGHLPCTPSSTTMVRLHHVISEFCKGTPFTTDFELFHRVPCAGVQSKGFDWLPDLKHRSKHKKIGGLQAGPVFHEIGGGFLFPGSIPGNTSLLPMLP